jgi:hypothetical protein
MVMVTLLHLLLLDFWTQTAEKERREKFNFTLEIKIQKKKKNFGS